MTDCSTLYHFGLRFTTLHPKYCLSWFLLNDRWVPPLFGLKITMKRISVDTGQMPLFLVRPEPKAPSPCINLTDIHFITKLPLFLSLSDKKQLTTGWFSIVGFNERAAGIFASDCLD